MCTADQLLVTINTTLITQCTISSIYLDGIQPAPQRNCSIALASQERLLSQTIAWLVLARGHSDVTQQLPEVAAAQLPGPCHDPRQQQRSPTFCEDAGRRHTCSDYPPALCDLHAPTAVGQPLGRLVTKTLRPAGEKKRAALLVLTPSFIKQLKEHLLLLCAWNNAGCLQEVYRAVGDKTWKPVKQSFPAAERRPVAWPRLTTRSEGGQQDWAGTQGSRPTGSATGSQGWITEGLGSHTTGFTSSFLQATTGND